MAKKIEKASAPKAKKAATTKVSTAKAGTAKAKTAATSKAKTSGAAKAKKPAASAAKAKKPAEKKPGAKSPKVMNLFDAYTSDQLPRDQGYIISSFINGNTGYSIYEVISYSGVKAIYPEGSGLTFQSSGRKLHALIEPPSYPHKGIEPYLREKNDQIPLRFKEVDKHFCKNQSTIYWAQKPIESLSSFSVARPTGLNVAFVFYDHSDLYDTLAKFFERSFTSDAGLPMIDARKGGAEITAIVKKFMNFKGQFD